MADEEQEGPEQEEAKGLNAFSWLLITAVVYFGGRALLRRVFSNPAGEQALEKFMEEEAERQGR